MQAANRHQPHKQGSVTGQPLRLMKGTKDFAQAQRNYVCQMECVQCEELVVSEVEEPPNSECTCLKDRFQANFLKMWVAPSLQL